MPDESGAEYVKVRGLVLGLAMLRAINLQDGGRSTLAQLSQETGLHRTTVRRLLETLIAEGYVRRSESDDQYRLTLAVRSLSEGFRDEDWVASIAAPALSELLQAVVWPSDITTPHGVYMIIRETTHRFSPLSFHRAMVGQSIPMLLTAAGRAFFAYCPEVQREEVLRLARNGEDEQARLAADDRLIANIVSRTRERGYATNDGEWTSQRKVGAIGAPILLDGRPVAAVNIVYLNKLLTPKEAERRFWPALQRVSMGIEERLKERLESGDGRTANDFI